MIWLWSALASASQWSEPPELAELVQRARAVVVGTVESAETEQVPYGLSTRYEIRVSEEELVVMELPGGRWEGLTQRFSGVPLWEVGQTVLVFVPPEGEKPSLAALAYSTGTTSAAPMSGRPSDRASPSTSTSTTSR
jgi:hypothetical protein